MIVCSYLDATVARGEGGGWINVAKSARIDERENKYYVGYVQRYSLGFTSLATLGYAGSSISPQISSATNAAAFQMSHMGIILTVISRIIG